MQMNTHTVQIKRVSNEYTDSAAEQTASSATSSIHLKLTSEQRQHSCEAQSRNTTAMQLFYITSKHSKHAVALAMNGSTSSSGNLAWTPAWWRVEIRWIVPWRVVADQQQMQENLASVLTAGWSLPSAGSRRPASHRDYLLLHRVIQN